jgi:primosomal protein N' (replication factor Y)
MTDYTAGEKAYSNISQVAGRAGRGDLKGRVIIPTSDSNNYILNAIISNDYEEFYEKEIEYRKMFNYPPYLDIVLFELSSKDFNILKMEADRLYNILNDSNTNLYKVFTPRFPFVRRINNKYRINILIKTKLSKEVYNEVYLKLNIFNQKKKKEINMSITKNPTNIS